MDPYGLINVQPPETDIIMVHPAADPLERGEDIHSLFTKHGSAPKEVPRPLVIMWQTIHMSTRKEEKCLSDLLRSIIECIHNMVHFLH